MGGGLPEGTQIVPGAMPEGSALFYLGSTLHGAGQHDGSAPPRDGLVFRQAFGLAQDAPSRRVHDTSHRLIFIYYLGWLNNLINFHFGAPPASQSSLGEGGAAHHRASPVNRHPERDPKGDAARTAGPAWARL